MIPGIPYLKLAAFGALAIAVLSALGYVWWLRHEVTNLKGANAVLTADLAQAVEVNKGNVAELDKIKADADRTLAAVSKEHAAELERAKRTASLKESIARAPKADDAPMAPVLKRVLDGLRVVPPGVVARDAIIGAHANPKPLTDALPDTMPGSLSPR